MGREPKKKKDRGGWQESAVGFNNPFAALSPGTEVRSETAADAIDSSPTDSDRKSTPPVPSRAVLRLERKGHGGKEVTLVTHLELTPAEMSTWCKTLRKQLGCGGHVDGATLVFHGDQRERLLSMLEERGVKRISN